MKQNYLNQIALICLFSVVVFISSVACNRDDAFEESLENDVVLTESYDAKTRLVVQRIKNFEKQIKEVKQGVYRGDSYIDVDSALWNIESLFNVTYSFPEKHYVDKKIQELTFGINTYNNKLLMNDVNSLYEDIIESVREAYLNDGFYTDKSLMSIFVEKGDCSSRLSEVKVVVVSGRTAYSPFDYKPYLYGPFDVDECWFYGELGGSCDDPHLLTDAAELIEDTINYFHGYKPPTSDNNNYRSIYVNLLTVSLMGNEFMNKAGNDYYLFYKQNCGVEELYLDVNKLNEYYYAEVDVILNIIPDDSKYSSEMPDDIVFMEVDINGVSGYVDNQITYMHNNFIFYGSPYCVKKDEFGRPKDLLYQ